MKFSLDANEKYTKFKQNIIMFMSLGVFYTLHLNEEGTNCF